MVHAWFGVVIAAALILIAASGLVSLFRGEMVRATVPGAGTPAPDWSGFGAALARFERAEPGAFVSVKFAPYGLGVHRLYLTRGRGAFLDADGRVVERPSRPRIEDVALNIHNHLFLGGAGERLIGLVGIGGLLMVISGLVIWLPARRGFSLRLWPRSGARRDLLSSHRSLGVIAALFLLVQLGTGVAMNFDSVLQKALKPIPPRPAFAPPDYRGPPDWPRIIQNAHQAFPQASIRRAAAPSGQADGVYSVYLQQRGDLNPEGGTRVWLDGQGRPLASSDERRFPFAGRVLNSALGLHSGMFGAPLPRLLVGLTGLGLMAMAGLGAASFLLGRRPRPKP